MKVKMLGVMVAGLGMLAAAVPALAHHSFSAEYDRSKPITLTGKVTKVEWMNPHARFYLDVKDDSGKVTNWEFELGSPNGLMRQGWTRHSLKEGDVVTVNGSRAKDGSNLVNASKVAFENGKRVLGGASSRDNPDTK
ncbi:MAG TPA: DUF6152 family protein [Bryobacteraceae bacterium]|nr:DUF6152 family protein [Bryobacteraceae bacterium]